MGRKKYGISHLKGNVHQDLTKITSYINQQIFLQGCPGGIFVQIFFSATVLYFTLTSPGQAAVPERLQLICTLQGAGGPPLSYSIQEVGTYVYSLLYRAHWVPGQTSHEVLQLFMWWRS
jgi:hypothetical protein